MTGALLLSLLGSCQDVHAYCGCEQGDLHAAASIDGGVLTTGLGFIFPIDDAGRFQCQGVFIDAQKYVASFDAGTCVQTLDEAGLVQPPCHDVRGPCGCSSAPGIGAALLLLLVRRRR